MAQKLHSPEEIFAKIGQADAALAEGNEETTICKSLGVTRGTLSEWRKIPAAYDRLSKVPPEEIHKHDAKTILYYLIAIEGSASISNRAFQSSFLNEEEIRDLLNSELVGIFSNLYDKNKITILKIWAILQSANIICPRVYIVADIFAARTLSSLFASRKAREILNKYIENFEHHGPAVEELGLTAQLKYVCAEICRRTDELERAQDILMELIMERPMDPRNYLQLAIINLFQNDFESLKNAVMADSLSKRFRESIVTILLFNLIREHRFNDAWTKFATNLPKDESRQLFLSASQIAFAEDKGNQGLKWLQRYFVSQGLELDINCEGRGFSEIFQAQNAPAPRFEPERQPLVSIIMTAFNSEDLLNVSVESVLRQTYENFELIIVDDASTDETRDYIDAFCQRDARVKAIYKKTNDGTYVSKNVGITQASGEFITFFDSDDFMHPIRIEQHIKHTSIDYILSYSLWIRLDENGNPAIRNTGGFLHMNPTSTFLRAKVFDEVGFFDSVRIGADSEFFWRCFWRYGEERIRVIELPLAIGRRHEASLSLSGVGAFDDNRISPVRTDYAEGWVDWHTRTDTGELFMPFPLKERPFAAPEEIVSDFDGRQYKPEQS